jgi:H+/Cl- antiporter ClcA
MHVDESPGVRWLIIRSVPALAIGILSAFVLYGVDWVSEQLEHVIWHVVPGSLGIDPAHGWWTLGVLTVIGLLVGLVLQFAPGHGGFDSATHELEDATILPLKALPGLLVIAILVLAGGVSLGPESPVMAINAALIVALVGRFTGFFSAPLAALAATSGTLGAMFGTPVAAALLLTGLVAATRGGGALWDRLFIPLVAAGAGAVTTTLIGGPDFSMHLPPAPTLQIADVLFAAIVATVAAALGVAGAFVFPLVHRLFHSIRSPLLMATAGGIVLGLLGMLGGPITLFKGLNQTGELLADPAIWGVGALVAMILIKLAALIVGASSGFRGGRIFPSVFIGAAIGVLASAIIPDLPIGLAVASGILGILLAVGRDGWLALFLAVLVAGDMTILPILCLAVLPAWLVVTRAPHFIVPIRAAAGPIPTRVE